MSKKRTSPESSNDEQTNEGSDSVFQQDNIAKRAKLMPLSDTTLQDLPVELIECILIKAVTMEVEGMNLVKSVWKEKADLVISRLTAVCPQWSSILTTNFFQNEIYRILDATAQKTIRFEILHQSPFELNASEAMTLKDELFILCRVRHVDYSVIHVYDRNNVAEVKDVIPLPGIRVEPAGIAACNVSNCLYILNQQPHHLSVLRITRTNEHQFNISPLISHLRRRYFTLTVAANGSLILLWHHKSEQRAVISVYDANGFLQYETRLISDTYRHVFRIIPKSNGNFVLVSFKNSKTTLTEIDRDGAVLRQYQSSLDAFNIVCQADIYGRIFIADKLNVELLDSELNLLKYYTGTLWDDYCVRFFYDLHYNSERNEVVAILDNYTHGGIRFIFRLTEE